MDATSPSTSNQQQAAPQGPTSWVDPEDYDYLDFNLGVKNELMDLPQVSLEGEGMGHLERIVGVDGLNKAIAKFENAKHDGKVTGSIDIQSRDFDPINFLTFVFSGASFESIQEFLDELDQEQKVDPEEIRVMVASMLPRFVTCKDAIDRLASDAQLESDTSAVDLLQSTYNELVNAAHSMFKPMLDYHQRSQSFKAALDVIAQSRQLLVFPGMVRGNIEREEYEAVVANCNKARALAEAWSTSRNDPATKLLVQQVLKEIDILSSQCRDSLMKRLTVSTSSAEDVSRAIGFLHQLGEKDQEAAHIACIDWHVKDIEASVLDVRHDYIEKMAVMRGSKNMPMDARAKGSVDSVASSVSQQQEEIIFATDIMHKILRTIEHKMVQFHRLAVVVSSHSSTVTPTNSSKSMVKTPSKRKGRSPSDICGVEKYLQPITSACDAIRFIFVETYGKDSMKKLLSGGSAALAAEAALPSIVSASTTTAPTKMSIVSEGAVSELQHVLKVRNVFNENGLASVVGEALSQLWDDLASVCLSAAFDRVNGRIIALVQRGSVTKHQPETASRLFVDQTSMIIEEAVKSLLLSLGEKDKLIEQLWLNCMSSLTAALDGLHDLAFRKSRDLDVGLDTDERLQQELSLVMRCCERIREEGVGYCEGLFSSIEEGWRPNSTAAVGAIDDLHEASLLLEDMVLDAVIRDLSAIIRQKLSVALISLDMGEDVGETMHDVMLVIGRGHYHMRHSPNMQKRFLITIVENTFQCVRDTFNQLPEVPSRELVMNMQMRIAFLGQSCGPCMSEHSAWILENIRRTLYMWLGVASKKDQEEADNNFKVYGKEGIKKAMQRSKMLVDCFKTFQTDSDRN